MRQALQQASLAIAAGEVPVGAIVVRAQTVIGRAYNQVELLKDPTAHAEMIAITQAAGAIGDWRLTDTVLYVTKEPCPMCAGAIILARIAEVYFGACDPKAGCCGTLMNLLEDTRFNHRATVFPGLLAEECGALLTNFFRSIRETGRTRRAEAN